MGNKNFDLTCFSYLTVGKILRIREYPKLNYGTEILEVIKTLAADGPMLAITCARLNLRVGLITNPIGEDKEGNKVIDYFKKHKVITKIEKSSRAKTPFIIILSDLKGNREWFPYIPDATTHLQKANLELIARSSLVYIDYYQIIQEASQRAIDFAYQHKIPSFINLGGSPFTPEISGNLQKKGIAIVQTNLEEDQIQNAIPLAQSVYSSIKPQIAIVTLGSKGAIAFTRQGVIAVPTFKVKIKHLHGAGAVFSAGFIFGYLKGWEVEKCLRFGCTLGTINCTLERGFEVFSQKEVKKFLEKWPK